MRHALTNILWVACVGAAMYLGFLLGQRSVQAAEDSTACSVPNLKHPDQGSPTTPDLFTPPVFPGFGGIGEGGCQGWNACPCLEDCEAKTVAACEPEGLD